MIILTMLILMIFKSTLLLYILKRISPHHLWSSSNARFHKSTSHAFPLQHRTFKSIKRWEAPVTWIYLQYKEIKFNTNISLGNLKDAGELKLSIAGPVLLNVRPFPVLARIRLLSICVSTAFNLLGSISLVSRRHLKDPIPHPRPAPPAPHQVPCQDDPLTRTGWLDCIQSSSQGWVSGCVGSTRKTLPNMPAQHKPHVKSPWPPTCGGRGKIRVVELFLRATAHPRLWALKFRNCCMKSELSIRAMSAKWRSHRIWFLKRRALLWFGPVRLRPQLLHLRHSSW